MATNPVGRSQSERKLSRKDALKKISTLIEGHMTEQGFSETEKNRRVAKFSKRAHAATSARAKS